MRRPMPSGGIGGPGSCAAPNDARGRAAPAARPSIPAIEARLVSVAMKSSSSGSAPQRECFEDDTSHVGEKATPRKALFVEQAQHPVQQLLEAFIGVRVSRHLMDE